MVMFMACTLHVNYQKKAKCNFFITHSLISLNVDFTPHSGVIWEESVLWIRHCVHPIVSLLIICFFGISVKINSDVFKLVRDDSIFHSICFFGRLLRGGAEARSRGGTDREGPWTRTPGSVPLRPVPLTAGAPHL